MKNYKLAMSIKSATMPNLPMEEIEEYRILLEKELLRLDAGDDVSLVSDSVIVCAILNHRKPEDIAWAVSQ